MISTHDRISCQNLPIQKWFKKETHEHLIREHEENIKLRQKADVKFNYAKLEIALDHWALRTLHKNFFLWSHITRARRHTLRSAGQTFRILRSRRLALFVFRHWLQSARARKTLKLKERAWLSRQKARLFNSWASTVNRQMQDRVTLKENAREVLLFWVKAAKRANRVTTIQARLTIKTNRNQALRAYKHWSYQASACRKLRLRRTLTRRVTFINFFGKWKLKTQLGKTADRLYVRKWFNLWSESTSLKKVYSIVSRGERFGLAPTLFNVLTIPERRAIGVYRYKLVRTAFNRWVSKFVREQQLNVCRVLSEASIMKKRRRRAFTTWRDEFLSSIYANQASRKNRIRRGVATWYLNWRENKIVCDLKTKANYYYNYRVGSVVLAAFRQEVQLNKQKKLLNQEAARFYELRLESSIVRNFFEFWVFKRDKFRSIKGDIRERSLLEMKQATIKRWLKGSDLSWKERTWKRKAEELWIQTTGQHILLEWEAISRPNMYRNKLRRAWRRLQIRRTWRHWHAIVTRDKAVGVLRNFGRQFNEDFAKKASFQIWKKLLILRRERIQKTDVAVKQFRLNQVYLLLSYWRITVYRNKILKVSADTVKNTIKKRKMQTAFQKWEFLSLSQTQTRLQYLLCRKVQCALPDSEESSTIETFTSCHPGKPLNYMDASGKRRVQNGTKSGGQVELLRNKSSHQVQVLTSNSQTYPISLSRSSVKDRVIDALGTFEPLQFSLVDRQRAIAFKIKNFTKITNFARWKHHVQEKKKEDRNKKQSDCFFSLLVVRRIFLAWRKETNVELQVQKWQLREANKVLCFWKGFSKEKKKIPEIVYEIREISSRCRRLQYLRIWVHRYSRQQEYPVIEKKITFNNNQLLQKQYLRFWKWELQVKDRSKMDTVNAKYFYQRLLAKRHWNIWRVMQKGAALKLRDIDSVKKHIDNILRKHLTRPPFMAWKRIVVKTTKSEFGSIGAKRALWKLRRRNQNYKFKVTIDYWQSWASTRVIGRMCVNARNSRTLRNGFQRWKSVRQKKQSLLRIRTNSMRRSVVRAVRFWLITAVENSTIRAMRGRIDALARSSLLRWRFITWRKNTAYYKKKREQYVASVFKRWKERQQEKMQRLRKRGLLRKWFLRWLAVSDQKIKQLEAKVQFYQRQVKVEALKDFRMGLEISKHWAVELSFAVTHWRKTVFWNALEQMARFSGRQCAWRDKERRIHQSRNYYTVKKLWRVWLDAYMENQRNKAQLVVALNHYRMIQQVKFLNAWGSYVQTQLKIPSQNFAECRLRRYQGVVFRRWHFQTAAVRRLRTIKLKNVSSYWQNYVEHRAFRSNYSLAANICIQRYLQLWEKQSKRRKLVNIICQEVNEARILRRKQVAMHFWYHDAFAFRDARRYWQANVVYKTFYAFFDFTKKNCQSREEIECIMQRNHVLKRLLYFLNIWRKRMFQKKNLRSLLDKILRLRRIYPCFQTWRIFCEDERIERNNLELAETYLIRKRLENSFLNWRCLTEASSWAVDNYASSISEANHKDSRAKPSYKQAFTEFRRLGPPRQISKERFSSRFRTDRKARRGDYYNRSLVLSDIQPPQDELADLILSEESTDSASGQFQRDVSFRDEDTTFSTSLATPISKCRQVISKRESVTPTFSSRKDYIEKIRVKRDLKSAFKTPWREKLRYNVSR